MASIWIKFVHRNKRSIKVVSNIKNQIVLKQNPKTSSKPSHNKDNFILDYDIKKIVSSNIIKRFFFQKSQILVFYNNYINLVIIPKFWQIKVNYNKLIDL